MNYLTLMFLQDVAPAVAQNTSKGFGGNYSMIIMMALIFVVMWLLMIRPQQKRQKELNNFRNSLQVGQKVITAGGIYGKIKDIKENYILLEIDSNVDIRIDKSMVMRDPSENPQKK